LELLEKIIQSSQGPGAKLLNKRLVGGGCINHGARIETSEGVFFVKWSSGERDMYDAEVHGLTLLRENTFLKVPLTIHSGTIGNASYLLMEQIDAGLSSNQFWPNFSTGLAGLHRVSSEYFGLDRNNYIGSLPQLNKKTTQWSDFFINYRLQPQLEMAINSGKIDRETSRQFDQLFVKIDQLIPKEPPALLHGDLWSGNFLTDKEGQPALIDPAVYYGHRETEIAFTKLFGGFSERFYQCYHEEFPLEPGFDERVDLHNLYPLMVHVNLFGSSYLSGVLSTLAKHC